MIRPASPTPPTPDANLAERSPWFPRDILPLADRPGWYETREWHDALRMWGRSTVRWWDGHVFRSAPRGVAVGFGFHPRDQWRGRNIP